ncbi:MAG: caspase family protein [Spirochaetota bacterium]
MAVPQSAEPGRQMLVPHHRASIPSPRPVLSIVFSAPLQYITTMLMIFSTPRWLRPALKTAAGLLTAAIIFSTAACKINPSPPDRYALVYGVSIYDDSNPENDGSGPNLVWTDNDAVDIAIMLNKKGYDVRLRVNDGTSTLLDSSEASLFNLAEANLTTFENDMAYYQNSNNIGKDDIFLFYFSGHGTNSDEFDASEIEQEDMFSNSADEFLVLPDYDNEGDEPPYYDFITDNYLGKSLNSISAIKKVVILDSCFSGGFIGQTYDVDRIEDDYSSTAKYKDHILSLALSAFFNNSNNDITPQNAIVLTASGESENSLEPPASDTTFKNGFFTEGLLYASDLGDYNNDGYISALEMYRYSNAYLMNLFSSSVYGVSLYEYSPHISGGPVDYVLFEAD